MGIPRSRGAVSGAILILLGLAGALVALIGPYFDFTIGVDSAWNFGEGHFWLSVVPGVVTALGGFILLTSANRATAVLGSWIALAGGVWFVIGEQISQLWNGGESIAGDALGGTGQRVAEQLAYFDGIGALIITFAALALGRLTVRSLRDVEYLEERDRLDTDGDGVADTSRPTRESGRFDRERAGEPAREPVTTTAGPGPAPADQRTDTLTAADRVREVAGEERRGRGLFRRSR